MQPSQIIGLVVVSIIIWWVVRAASSGGKLQIIIDENGLIRSTGLSQAMQRKMERFLQSDVIIESRITIVGRTDQHGQLRFEFRGDIAPGTQQQFRNFLHTIL